MAKGSSGFFDELAAWGARRGGAEVELGPEPDEEENPLLGYRAALREALAGAGAPSRGRRHVPDRMARGRRRRRRGRRRGAGRSRRPARRRGASRVRGGRGGAQVARRASARARGRRGRRVRARPAHLGLGERRDRLRHLSEALLLEQRAPAPFSGPAARIGTEVHRWIERRSVGQGTLIEPDEVPDLTAEELAGEPGKVTGCARRSSRAGSPASCRLHRARVPAVAERLGRRRADRHIFGEDDGPWEVVDWKTGRRPQADDPLASLQLDIYGLACVEIWGRRPEDLPLTYLYLASGEEVSHPMGDPAEVRTRVGASLAEISRGEFEPNAGSQCRFCDFRSFCDAGKAWWQPIRPELRGAVREPLDRLLERPVLRGGVVAALRHARNEPRRQAGLLGSRSLRTSRNHARWRRLARPRSPACRRGSFRA